ncbi:MAG: hypothetical protein Ct9H300mP28_36820 [Pseudomonadota bacterium]|nr:MAG: hypothetical protein Ct9H300mP28_36820 [Pseudomonadota bacterium]
MYVDCPRKRINLFDNAETYGNPVGAAEEIMGEAMTQFKKKIRKILGKIRNHCGHKIFWGGNGVNERGLSRKHINEGWMHLCSACKWVMSICYSVIDLIHLRQLRLLSGP